MQKLVVLFKIKTQNRIAIYGKTNAMCILYNEHHVYWYLRLSYLQNSDHWSIHSSVWL